MKADTSIKREFRRKPAVSSVPFSNEIHMRLYSRRARNTEQSVYQRTSITIEQQRTNRTCRGCYALISEGTTTVVILGASV